MLKHRTMESLINYLSERFNNVTPLVNVSPKKSDLEAARVCNSFTRNCTYYSVLIVPIDGSEEDFARVIYDSRQNMYFTF